MMCAIVDEIRLCPFPEFSIWNCELICVYVTFIRNVKSLLRIYSPQNFHPGYAYVCYYSAVVFNRY